MKSANASTVAGIVLLLSTLAVLAAQSDSGVAGTTGVSFQPVQTGGVLRGCTLVYQAVAPDYAYRAGQPIVLVGNIAVQRQANAVMLALKIGVSDYLADGKSIFQPPHFAYLQTSTATTAKARHIAADGDPGFRLFVVSLEDEAAKLIGELIASTRVTIGFNRREGGLDVLVPLDLTVSDLSAAGGKVVRHRSEVAVQGFQQCVLDILRQGAR